MTRQTDVQLLLIHGVGEQPSRATEQKAEKQLAGLTGEGPHAAIKWYSWNPALGRSDDHHEYVREIAHAARVAARLEYPAPGNLGRIRSWLYHGERTLGRVGTLAFSALVLCGLWITLAKLGQLLAEDPAALGVGVRMRHLLFPPLDPLVFQDTLVLALAGLRWTALATGAVMACQVVLAIASSVPLRVAVRCAVLDATRPLLAVANTPMWLLTIGLVAGVFGVASRFCSRPVQNVDVAGAPIGSTGFGACAGWIAWLLLAGLALGVVWGVLRGPLKVFSDIVRYLGDSPYRSRIHDHLSKQLQELPEGPIVVVAHSLGSVIAVDSLLAHPHVWARFRTIRLVTCGSPLRRLFHRFFPGGYAHPKELAALAARNHQGLTWHNVSRPLDYIGGGFGAAPAIVDAHLPQRWRCHIDYWTDLAMSSCVAGHVRDTVNQPPSQAAVHSYTELPLNRLAVSAPVGDRTFQWLGLALCLAGLALVLVNQIAFVPVLEQRQADYWDARLASDGVDAKGELRPAREEDVSEDFSGEQRAIGSIVFTDATGTQHTLAAWDATRPDIDWDQVHIALFGKVLDSALVTGLWALVGVDDPLLAQKDPVPVSVRYVRGDPRTFRLPPRFHHPAQSSGGTTTGRILGQAALWLCWWLALVVLLRSVLGMTWTPVRARDDRRVGARRRTGESS